MTDVRLTALNPEDSQVYPVACNTSGELKLEKQPTFDGNVDGDLTVSGTASFGGDATINTLTVGRGGGSVAYNTAVGNGALQANTAGNFNTAVGRGALESNTEGTDNAALGRNALFTNTTGNYNTAVGRSALEKNTTGINNTAVGRGALESNTEGVNNTTVGNGALFTNTTGNYNTAVGKEALNLNTTGNYNTAVGLNALLNNTTGSLNTAVGNSAGFHIKGNRNTILGAYYGTAADDDLNDTVIISAGETERMRIDSNRVATFQGDVVVSSRGKKWMLVEQGGLCHMVQQATATTAVTEYPKLRDVFAELNVIERALEEVMEKLRMTEPDGWPVWDGSDNS